MSGVSPKRRSANILNCNRPDCSLAKVHNTCMCCFKKICYVNMKGKNGPKKALVPGVLGLVPGVLGAMVDSQRIMSGL